MTVISTNTPQAPSPYQAHVVFQPIAVPPDQVSEGCKENSWFRAEDFQGYVVAEGPFIQLNFGFPSVVLVQTLGPTDVDLGVHFGPEPNKPLVTFRADTPVLTPFGEVKSLQIVGGELVPGK